MKNLSQIIQKAGQLEKFINQVNRPKLENKTSFFRLLAVTQKAWLGIRESLEMIAATEKHKWLRNIILDIINQINQWVDISTALRNHNYFFENSEIELIKSSEQMWNLPETLEVMAEELEKLQKIKWKIKSALTYPITVLIFAVIAVIVLLIKVIPTISEMFPSKDKLPWITIFMLKMSAFMQVYWWTIILWIVGIILLIKIIYENVLSFKIAVDRYFLIMPHIWSLVKTFYWYRFSKLLWDFHNAWIWSVEAFEQMASIFGNYHYKKKLIEISEDLKKWYNLADSIEGSWLFNPVLISLIWVGEESWQMGQLLGKVALFYRDELEVRIESTMKLIEPMLMAFIAAVIWTIVAAVFLPMADLVWSIWW